MKRLLLLMFCFLSLGTSAYSQKLTDTPDVETIVFFRHAEKPFWDMGQLICQGLNRSLALPDVLVNRYGKPQIIFAPKSYWDGYFYYVRGYVTVAPTAIQYQVPINNDFYYHDIKELATALLIPAYRHSVIFVGWEHVNIVLAAQEILRRFGANWRAVPSWSRMDYDSIYVVTVDWSRIKVTFNHEYQYLEGQSEICPSVQPNNAIKHASISKIVLVPDAEVQDSLPNQLSCQGLNRALYLSKVISKQYPNIDLFMLPEPKLENKGYYLTSLMTIEPTIIGLGGLFIPVSKDFKSVVPYLTSHIAGNEVSIITWPYAELARLAREIYQSYHGNVVDIPDPIPNHNTIYEIVVINNSKALPIFRMLHYDGIFSTICPSSVPRI